MLDILSKKVVTTRKDHTCHYCELVIEKGKQAISASAKEDEQRINLYFHVDCSARHARSLCSVNQISRFSEFNEVKFNE